MSEYPYSKHEGGIILSIILIIWGIGAHFESYPTTSMALLSVGILLFMSLFYLRYIRQ